MIDMPASGRERLGAGVLAGAAVLFVGFAVPRAAAVGFFGALTLPLVLLAADLVIATALVTWWYPLRPVAQGLSVFGALVHALVMLRGGPVWTRGCSGVLLLAHCWALVQLFLMTAAEDDDDSDDSDERGDERGDEHGYRDTDGELGEHAAALPFGIASGETAGFVETPVTDVVDVAAPAQRVAPPEHPEPEHDEAGDGPAGSAGTPDGHEHEHEGRIR